MSAHYLPGTVLGSLCTLPIVFMSYSWILLLFPFTDCGCCGTKRLNTMPKVIS